ncbi:hypothetical protein DQ384_33570 [Sphaerisporangium album]|uniref:Lipoprotein n=1 Tax=Sphaerisporangium album TaxID=509200 RepID=A0A367F217_9ACTN|nr:hypothetical protein [Sphaerisporangium album]RCG23989.1 hypothetical protein DQ384_33570 [Sphaerisporangium album]
MRARRRALAALTAAFAAAAALGGCAAKGGPATVEELAAMTGCPKPQIQVDATELRQAMCTTSKGRYSVTTFATDRGQREWLDDSLGYGGAYLEGTRWIVLANTPEMLETFRQTLGGSVRSNGHVMPSGGAAGSR